MYIPEQFAVTDHEKIVAFIKAHSFGQLISTVESRLFSSHLPFFLSNDGNYLYGHVSKKNPQWNSIAGQEVLVTFQGPDDYISPTWYESPGVPTWNYQAVHIYGNCALITDLQQLQKLLDKLTTIHESKGQNQWVPEYQESLLNAIIGFEIKISEIQCKFKLSQNRSSQDRLRVSSQLQKIGSIHLSQAIKNEL